MSKLLILYGSQTGTAQGYAERVAHEAYLRTIPYEIYSMQNFPVTSLPDYPAVVFLASTTGDGEAPSTMVPFWRYLLRQDLPTDWLAGVSCSVMGLGDSSYEKFCWVGKRLARRLEQLGATFVVGRIDGDEQHPLGLDGAFLPWIESLWVQLSTLYGWPASPLRPWEAAVSLCVDEARVEQQDGVEITQLKGHTDVLMQERLLCSKNDRITADDHFQDVRTLIFSSLNNQTLPPFAPGDVAILSPENSATDVDEIIDLLHWSEPADLSYRIRPNRPEVALRVPHPPVSSLRALLTSHLDITAPPRQTFFTLLLRFYKSASASATQAALHEEKLAEIASPEGLDLYLDYVWRPRRKPAEVLRDFPTSVPPEYVFDLFPSLKAREYSIASAWVASPRDIHLTCALVQYKTILPTPRWGVCSQWVQTLVPQQSVVTIAFRKGSWNVPVLGPLLLVAAGTGIAPIRALIQHLNATEPQRPLYLFFGCRSTLKDFHHREEWSQYPQLKVHAIGSRDAPGPRQYVDKLLFCHADLVKELLLSQGASVFVAGNSKLPALVKKTISDVCSDAELPELLCKLGRLQVEAWS